MKTKKHLYSLLVAMLAIVIVAAFCVGCSSIPKSYSFEGKLYGEKEMPAFLELKEDGSVQLDYIMTMGNPNNTTHTTVTSKGSWTQDENGVITSVKLEEAGETFDAVIDSEEGTITIGYNLSFGGGTPSVHLGEVKEGGKNFVFNTKADK